MRFHRFSEREKRAAHALIAFPLVPCQLRHRRPWVRSTLPFRAPPLHPRQPTTSLPVPDGESVTPEEQLRKSAAVCTRRLASSCLGEQVTFRKFSPGGDCRVACRRPPSRDPTATQLASAWQPVAAVASELAAVRGCPCAGGSQCGEESRAGWSVGVARRRRARPPIKLSPTNPTNRPGRGSRIFLLFCTCIFSLVPGVRAYLPSSTER